MKYNIPLPESFLKGHVLSKDCSFEQEFHAADKSFVTEILFTLDEKEKIVVKNWRGIDRVKKEITIKKGATLRIDRLQYQYGSIYSAIIILEKNAPIIVNDKTIITKKESRFAIRTEYLNELEFEYSAAKKLKILRLWQKPDDGGAIRCIILQVKKDIICPNENCENHYRPANGNFCDNCGSKTEIGEYTIKDYYHTFIASKEKYIVITQEKADKLAKRKYSFFVADFRAYPRTPYKIFCEFELEDKTKQLERKYYGEAEVLGFKKLTFQIYHLTRNKNEKEKVTDSDSIKDYDLLETTTSFSSAVNFCKKHINL